MGIDQRTPGAVHWIDHYVVCTTDVPRWESFHAVVLGATTRPEPLEIQLRRGIFQTFSRCRHGGFIARTPLPKTKGLGKGLPRYGFFIEAEDIDYHIKRLREVNAPHSEPMRTSADGADGTVIYWQDPDGNQFEFWAPDHMPDGAMVGCTDVKVGRISHAIFESRDLNRTAVLFGRYCALEPLQRAGIGPDTLVLPLVAGGRLIFRRVDDLEGRTSGFGLPDPHTALVIRCEDFFPAYERLWATLPEWDIDLRAGQTVVDPLSLPARTALHVSKAGRRFKALTGRGDDWFDWDTNLFHFYAGAPVGGSLSVYEGRAIDYFSDQWERTRGKIAALGAPSSD